MGDKTGVHLSMYLYVRKCPSKQNNKKDVSFEICLRIVVFKGMRGRISVSMLCTNCISIHNLESAVKQEGSGGIKL